MENDERKSLTATEVAEVLSKTLRDLAERKITLRQAMVVSRVAASLSKAIEIADLSDRVALLEQVLKKRK